MRAKPRWFAAWYVVSLGSVLLPVELGLMLRGARPTSYAMEAGPVEVLTVPPKPGVGDPVAENGVGDGGDAEAVVYTPERCAAMRGDYADSCYAALARQTAERDPDGGLAACAHIEDPDRAWECQADVAEAHAPVDVARARAVCEAIGRVKWRDQCVFGIAMAFAHTDPAHALRTCEDSGMWRPFCRHDVNGERAQEDPQGAVAYCASLDPQRRDTCWHGVGKYVGRLDPERAFALCAEAPTDGDLAGQCAHGVGWAAAESEGDAAIARCEGRDGLRDSCVLGVAYHAKRYDPVGAARLCEQAADAGERAHCLEVVGRAPTGLAP